MHTVSIALHRDCGVADQLKAALVLEILNYVTKNKDFAPVCSMYTHTVALFLNVYCISKLSHYFQVSSGLDMPSVAGVQIGWKCLYFACAFHHCKATQAIQGAPVSFNQL